MGRDNLTRAVEAAVQDRREELEEFVDAVPAMLWRLGADMRCSFVNAGWLAFTGRCRDEELGTGWTEGLHPEDFEPCLAALAAGFEERRAFGIEARLRRHDGSYRWLHGTARPLWHRGRFAGFAGTSHDIDRAKRVEASQREIIGELGHRIRNMLASVQAIAWQGFRASPDPKRAQDVFLSRLGAMANAQDLPTGESGPGADLAAVVARGLRSAGEGGARVMWMGEPVQVMPKRTMSLTLCLHELATNAVEHGALSAPEGQVGLSWARTGGRIVLEWRETGGPPVGHPRPTGFGLRLIRTLGREAGGEVQLEHAPEGFTCRLSFPEAD